MRIKTLFILLCMVMFIPIKAQNLIEKLVIYKSFWRGGTTTTISNMFKEPERYSIDTTNINTGKGRFLNEFGVILAKSKRKKHCQQKITGIEVAGEFWSNQSDRYFFIICPPNILINITNKEEYRIIDKFLLKELYKWMSHLKNGQTKDNLLLNETEGVFLNKIFETTRKDFDFTNKKIGFLTGSSGTKKSSKNHYFEMHEKHSKDANSPCDNGILYIFTVEQKSESGGYDAAIVYWSKFLVPIEKVVSRLKEQR